MAEKRKTKRVKKKIVGKEISKKEKPVVSEISKSDVMTPKVNFKWEAHEFHYYEKDRWWFLGIVMLFAVIVLSFVFVGNLPIGGLFAFVCALLVVVLYKNSKNEPKRYLMELTDVGVVFRDKQYSYDQFKSFTVVVEPQRVLYMEQVKFNYPLMILLEDQSPEQIRNFLLRYIPEHAVGGEHIADKLARFLRL